MARRRRRKNSRPVVVVGVIAALVFVAWWLYPEAAKSPVRTPTPLVGEQRESARTPPSSAGSSQPPAPGAHPKGSATAALPGAQPPPSAAASPTGPAAPSSTPTPTTNPGASAPQAGSESLDSFIRRGEQALAGGDVVAARRSLSEAVRMDPAGPHASRLRENLSGLADETLFSGRIFENDPLVERYVIRPGDLLAKIARGAKVSPELLARINGIADVNRIRAGQALKLVKGPFHAVVNKQTYVMDIYVQDALVRSYRVGLGADDSTPRGQWRVGTRLVNPTYYPPRGGDIVAADDPQNPLGERWIGLIGIAGEALGQERYGIHGTNEPGSIGTSNSLGCIRLHNKDVEEVYAMLVEQHSTVEVQ